MFSLSLGNSLLKAVPSVVLSAVLCSCRAKLCDVHYRENAPSREASSGMSYSVDGHEFSVPKTEPKVYIKRVSLTKKL